MHRILFLLFILAALASFPVRAQEVEDTIKIKTRVVFLDALVKDKKTSLPISDLTSANFEVFDNGKPRNISYFTREGEARRVIVQSDRGTNADSERGDDSDGEEADEQEREPRRKPAVDDENRQGREGECPTDDDPRPHQAFSPPKRRSRFA